MNKIVFRLSWCCWVTVALSPAVLNASPLLVNAAPILQAEQNDVSDSDHRRRKRGAYAPTTSLWPHNIVYYSLTNAAPGARKAFLQAANTISEKTALRFVERQSEENYIVVLSYHSLEGTPFSEGVGMRGGPQILYLPPLEWDNKGSILHEVMHALGIEHEHQRDDRDLYGAIVDAGIADSNLKQIEKKHSLRKVGPFDNDSVMLYDPMIFRPHAAVMAAVRPWPRHTLSAGDIDTINTLYPATASTSFPETTLSDNGLKVHASKQRVTFATNSYATVTLQFPQGVNAEHLHPKLVPLPTAPQPIQFASIRKDTGEHGTRFTIQLQASDKEGAAKLVLEGMVVDQQRNNVWVAALVYIVASPPQEVAQQYRQLVSRHRINGVAQCLQARRLKPNKRASVVAELFQPSPESSSLDSQKFSEFVDSIEIKYAAIEEDRRLLALARPCDSENLWQLWRYDASSAQLVSATGKHVLAVRHKAQPGTGFLRLKAALQPGVSPNNRFQRWYWNTVQQQFIYQGFPNTALSLANGGEVVWAPVPKEAVPAWQKWDWD